MRLWLHAVLLSCAAAGCADLEPTMLVSPSHLEQGSWSDVVFTLDGVPPRLLVAQGPEGLVLREDAIIEMQATLARILVVEGSSVEFVLQAEPPLGAHPVFVSNADGRWQSIDTVEVYDPRLPPAPPSLWSNARLVDLPSADELCPSAPVLTPDGLFLLLPSQRGNCGGMVEVHVYRWNDGAPIDTGEMLTNRGGWRLTSLTVMEDLATGTTGDYGIIYSRRNTTRSELVVCGLAGDPPALTAQMRVLFAGTHPSATRSGDMLVFEADSTLWEQTHALEGEDEEPRRMEELIGVGAHGAAISGDGLTLVYVARATAMADDDLYLARRTNLTSPFESVGPLPKGPGLVNTVADEHDPLIAPSGQLLFVSERTGRPALHIAEAL